jgi:Hypoxia induced protein conserved region
MSQPLVPIGCAATAYFLASGIQSFRNRDPVRSQKMMQARVMAQFVTLLCFIGYVGLDNADFRIAPMFQDVKKWKEVQEEERVNDNNRPGVATEQQSSMPEKTS